MPSCSAVSAKVAPAESAEVDVLTRPVRGRRPVGEVSAGPLALDPLLAIGLVVGPRLAVWLWMAVIVARSHVSTSPGVARAPVSR